MHPLDFISDSPHLYLFHKESIKTNFGGFLFLIYLVIIILIIVYYIIDYTKNDKYIVQSLTHINVDKGTDKKYYYNPNINFKLGATVSVKEQEYYLDEFKFYDFHLNKFID